MTNKNILLVEDNPDDEALAIRALKKSNLINDIAVARDGAEALDYLFCTGQYKDRDANDMPALILLDLKLPKIDGLEVLRRLRGDDRTKNLSIVALTSSSEEQDLIDSYDLHVPSYVRKPVDFNHITDAVAQVARNWLVLNAPPPKQQNENTNNLLMQ